MKNNKGFTLIELLAVIVVLAIIMVLAVTTVLPYMSKARQDAFRIEATYAVDAAKKVIHLYNIGELKVSDLNASGSCMSHESKKACFTIDNLIDRGIYDAEKGNFGGRVDVNISDLSKPTFTLYFQKGAEFRFVGESFNDYKDNGTINNNPWNDSYNTCTCD